MAGRPSKVQQWLTEDGLSMLTHYKRNDLSDAEIAKKIGIGATTFTDWKRRYPAISGALKNGMEYAVRDAEKALIEKLKTQTLIEEKEEVWQNEDGAVRKHKTVTKKQVPPDTTALIFFLKAKAGWRDAANTEIQKTTVSEKLRMEVEDFFNESKTTSGD